VSEDHSVEVGYTKSPQEVYEVLINKVTDVEVHRSKDYQLRFAERMRNRFGLDEAQIDVDVLVTAGLTKTSAE
jgi:hypothetical protein